MSQRVVQEIVEGLAEPRDVDADSSRTGRRPRARPPRVRRGPMPLDDRPRATPADRSSHRGPGDGRRGIGRAPADPRRAARGDRSRQTRSGAPRCSSSDVRGRASARSSSAFRIDSGVRSSWLASSTNASLALHRRLDPIEHRVQRGAQTRDLVVRRRERQAALGIGRGDRRRLSPHPLDRAERRAREQPPGDRDQDARRSASRSRASRRAAATDRRGPGARYRTTTTGSARRRLHRHGEQPRLTLSIPGSRRSKNVGARRESASRPGASRCRRTISFERMTVPEPSRTCANASSGSIKPEPTFTFSGPFFRASTTRIAARDLSPASTVSSRSAAVRR